MFKQGKKLRLGRFNFQEEKPVIYIQNEKIKLIDA